MTATREASPNTMIPARLRDVTGLPKQVFLATLVGLGLRLLFVLGFPASAGDTALYLQLARNLADHHVYGLWINGQLVPTDLRTPGYPAFLGGIALLLGRAIRPILLSQAILDLGTCLLTAVLALALAPPVARRRVALAGLWLATTCPFVANYSAVVLTEVLAAFLSTAACLCFVLSVNGKSIEYTWKGRPFVTSNISLACFGAFLTGLASLVRPEMPLLVGTAGIMLTLRWWKSFGWRKLARLGAAMGAAFLLPLAPWAARNVITLHEAQFLAPRDATLPGEYAPLGYYAWTKTWLTRYRDAYEAIWKIGDEPVETGEIPETAFDSPHEKARVVDLLEQYNASPNLDLSPQVDREFAEIARERTARNPLRTFVWVPFQRALTIWFTPRTELLPSSAAIWPIPEHWDENPLDVLVAIFFAGLNYFYVGLALGGIWVAWRPRRATGSGAPLPETANLWGLALLVAYFAARTVFLTTVEAPEPRYVVPCFPAVLALAALLWSRRSSR
jgi:hypothetical protein